MAQNPRTNETATPPTDGRKSQFTRRSYVRSIAAVAAATVAGGAAASTATAADSPEAIVVEAGEHRIVDIGDGETFENVLIDCTADGASVVLAAKGTDWTIRNVGIRGRVGSDQAVLGVADTGGNTSTIENVYLGDGAEDGHRIGLGVWVAPEHSGHLDIERVNIQEMGDNSFYCSAPGGAGGGTVALRNCYSANSWVAHFRLAEGTVENCTALNDDRHKDGRGVWAWGPGPVEVADCDLAMNGRHYSIVGGANGKATTVQVRDTEYGTDYNGGVTEEAGSTIDFQDGNGNSPEDSLPEGCPSSPEAAVGDN